METLAKAPQLKSNDKGMAHTGDHLCKSLQGPKVKFKALHSFKIKQSPHVCLKCQLDEQFFPCILQQQGTGDKQHCETSWVGYIVDSVLTAS